ncbi:amidase-like [Diadema antillarum]|uniref:amidase-like n=1 Tax=Diadema antillarum TaxID=105358 RepID=UPI003A846B20
MAERRDGKGCLYRTPMVVGPTLEEIEELSVELDLGLKGSPELRDYQSAIDDIVRGINELDELVEPTPLVKYPRTPGRRPSKADNPHNAWYYKSTITGASNGKLSGKRVAIKDSIAIAGIPMMMGCHALEGYVPDFDATVVTRVLDAGGVILGKATSEDNCGSGSSFTSAFGPVTNPYDDTHVAGGSSSGSAVVVANNEVDLAIGGDQGGSVRIPASWCGLVGLKPTFGLVPYTGAGSGELTLDHLGPITRTVEDCALMLEAIAGYDDGRDPRQPCNIDVPNYTKHLKDIKPETISVAVLKEGFGQDCSDPAVDRIVTDTIDRFAAASGATVSPTSMPLHRFGIQLGLPIDIIGGLDCVMHSGGAGLHHTGYYPTSMMKILATQFQQHKSKLAPLNKLMFLSGTYLKRNYCSLYGKAQNLRQLLTQQMEETLQCHDVIAMPTIPFTAPKIPSGEATEKEILEVSNNMLTNVKVSNLTGHPSITINVGFVGGLPVGLQLTGKKFGELRLLQIAQAFEEFVNAQPAQDA